MLDIPSGNERRPPGPEGLEKARWLYRIADDAAQAFADLVGEYGDAVRMSLPSEGSLYLFSTPDAAKYVLQDNHRNYEKASTYDFMRPVVGNGLLTSEGDFWLRQRRLVAPMFHRERIAGFAETMIETTRDLIGRWERYAKRGESVDVAEEMAELTLSIAGKTLFSRDVGSESGRIGDALLTMFRDVNYRILSPLPIPRSIPTPHNRRVDRALETLESIVFGMIDERRGREEEFDDLLSMLMLAEDEETGERMTDKQVRDELMTFLIAGHETTSNALAWTFYLLSKHPDVRRRLESTIDATLEGGDPTLERLGDLDYLEQVFDETTRLYPPAWTIEREPLEADEIDGFAVEAGSVVAVPPYLVHHNPDVWENPEGFDPSRFGDEAETPEHRYAHFPFGGGPRKCVGSHFAIMEAKIILSMILQRFRLNLTGNQRVVPEGTVTLYPKGGIEMEIANRESAEG